MKAPPDKQVQELLNFLWNALRSDEIIAGWTKARPEEILAYVANFQPIQRADGKSWLLSTKLPALHYNVVSATHQRKGTRWGRTLTGTLWYVFHTPQSESQEIHGLTKAERIKSLIDWRLNYWLHKQKLPETTGQSENFQDLSKIKMITVGQSTWFNEGDIQGLQMSIEMEHYWAPYDEPDPVTIAQYSVDITENPTSGNQLKVEADIDV